MINHVTHYQAEKREGMQDISYWLEIKNDSSENYRRKCGKSLISILRLLFE